MASSSEKESTRIQVEHQLLNQKVGFSAAFLAVQYLYSSIQQAPGLITRQTITALLSLIHSRRLDTKKQSYFLYKEACFALIHIALDKTHPLANLCISNLQESLFKNSGRKQRAISEALGSLPLNIAGPDIHPPMAHDRIAVSFDTLLHHCGNPDALSLQWHGRTLRFKLDSGQIGCIKFANSLKNAADLMAETQWLIFLRDNPPCSQSRFDIPKPVLIHNRSLFKLTCLPDFILKNHRITKEYLAIAFLTGKDYFHYPNEPCLFNDPKESVEEIFYRNAWLLGKLTSNGIIHTALIPLFHNRIQRSRRNDQGVYNWEQGGRLDKWLESSQYPNFSKSGLRDFEHLISIKTTKRLHHFIGEHILAFTLVAGSYFRNQAPDKKGVDQDGHPIDTRNLFDPPLFLDLVRTIIKSYYQALTGLSLKNTSHFLTHDLIDNLIENMGIDHHMEETLRIQDQKDMDSNEFDNYLTSRGCTDVQVTAFIKGSQDITLNTGPHLGGFNQPISVPKLIDLLFCLSSLCISDRYIMENGLKGS